MSHEGWGGAESMSELGRRVLAAQPFSGLVGAELTTFEPGHAELRLPLRPQLRQQFGVAHGGVLSYLADNTLTFAGGSVLGPSVLTAEYKISYLEPAVGDVLIARGSVLHVGRRQAVCRCDIFDVKDERETLCATAMGTIRAVREPSTADTAAADTAAGDTASADTSARETPTGDTLE